MYEKGANNVMISIVETIFVTFQFIHTLVFVNYWYKNQGWNIIWETTSMEAKKNQINAFGKLAKRNLLLSFKNTHKFVTRVDLFAF